MCFIDTPNLPNKNVKLAAVSNKFPKVIDSLNKLQIQVLPIKTCDNLSSPVNTHPDMILHHLGKNKIIVAKGEDYLATNLQKIGFKTICSDSSLEKLYPGDIKLNAARIGDKLFANKIYLDSNIKHYCEKNNIEIISVKQGYTKCSTVIVNKCSIITADFSIAKAAEKYNIDVLRISQGHIQLKGYEYGFLGGACGMIGKNKLAFAGNIKNHPDYNIIKKFCSNRNVDIISLSDEILTDVGGIIPLTVE